MPTTSTSLYIHLPFCASKCSYCDFNSIVAPAHLRDDYLEAMLREVRRTGGFYNERSFGTIYFGGGTPTIYPPEQLCQLLATIRGHYRLEPEVEVTIEANPGTVTPESLMILRESGFNRLSLGVQSFDDGELLLLGRRHDSAQAKEALAAARAAGFDNLSLDLINCLPGQTPERWRETLEEALRWRPEHLSCYGLSIEEGTPLYRQWDSGRIEELDEQTETEIFTLTHELLSGAEYWHYEISNYCKPGRRCRHNDNYWRNGEYVGLGAGAASYLNQFRMKSEPDPERWAERILAGMAPALVQREALDDQQQATETLMLALRTLDGLDLHDFCRRFGLEPERFRVRVKALVEAGLARWSRERLALTPERGYLLHSEIVQMFM